MPGQGERAFSLLSFTRQVGEEQKEPKSYYFYFDFYHDTLNLHFDMSLTVLRRDSMGFLTILSSSEALTSILTVTDESV
jgi:hypothetical protein